MQPIPIRQGWNTLKRRTRLLLLASFLVALLSVCSCFGVSLLTGAMAVFPVTPVVTHRATATSVAQIVIPTATRETVRLVPTATLRPAIATPKPTDTPQPTATSLPTETPVPTAIPTQAPTAAPTQPPVQPTATPAHTGIDGNPWGYDFSLGTPIYSPPSTFCSYFSCIANFWNGHGYVEECVDTTYSLSGGIRGVCSHHGGAAQELYSH